MRKLRKRFSVSEGKIQASLLLKALHSSDKESRQQAAKRFQCLPEFSATSISDILEKDIKRKHALSVVAIENGFLSWVDLKLQVTFVIGGHLNHWFSTYEEAKSHQSERGGYLFPYKNQFFIAGRAYVTELGFDPDDADWKLIDFDAAKPANKDAWQRLHKKWIATQNK